MVVHKIDRSFRNSLLIYLWVIFIGLILILLNNINIITCDIQILLLFIWIPLLFIIATLLLVAIIGVFAVGAISMLLSTENE